MIAGTYCKGEVQASFAKKFSNCKECDFYKLVKEEEGIEKFNSCSDLLDILKNQ